MVKGLFPIEELSARRTPFYYYDSALLRATLAEISSLLLRYPDWKVHYALKANFNPALLQIIAEYGLGADCATGGEIQAALDAGFAPDGIVYTGVGKRDEDIRLALNAGIGRFNVESVAELQVINEIATAMGKVAKVSFRVNPDMGAYSYANITTGLTENKFGIHHTMLEDAVKQALLMTNIELCGLHFHIGSQILDTADFIPLCNRINQCLELTDRLGVTLRDVNVGGGLGIEYDHPNHRPMADFASYFEVYKKHLHTKLPVHFELGRSVVAPCGTLISRVLYVKEGVHHKFVILDASMTELIRPALYSAYHRIENLTSEEAEEVYDVVGPISEHSDVFGKEVKLNRCRRGDLIAIRSAGAYGEAMASHFNCRPFPEAFISEQ
ncbi:MAG: diaminopimelate decarboxylase [Paludibacteraceae bacterium]|nr:diaminopimelate decarboxylase [Paludibacteraceae bacterium]